MTEKYNSRKWIAFCWFMSLVTLAIILAFICMFMNYDSPDVITNILGLSERHSGGYGGSNVIDKKVSKIIRSEKKGDESGTCKN